MTSQTKTTAVDAPARTGKTYHSARILWLSGLSCVLLLVVLLFANALLARAAVRIDLTEEGLYTLSDGSRKILNGLEDPARIRVFWHNVPLKFDHTKRYVAALLEEMETASDGKVQAQWVDMSEDAGVEQASEIGLAEHTFAVRYGSEFRQARGYMSLVIEIGDAPPEKINELANITDKLEYRIVSAIFKGQRAAPPVIGLVHQLPFNPMMGGRRPPQSRFAYLERELHLAFGSALRSYITLDNPVPEDVDVLIVCDPRGFSDKQVFRFEQFLLRGGRGILLLDPLPLDSVLGRNAQVVRSSPSGFEDWLSNLGVTVEKGCVVDFNEKASCLYPYDHVDRLGRLVGRDWVRYAHWPKVLPENADATNPVMRYLRPMAMYWPAGLSVDPKKQQEAGRSVKILARTTAEGYRRSDVTNIRQPGFSREGKVLEQVPLIALIEGPTQSFWADKPDPTAPPPDEEKKDEETKDEETKAEEGKAEEGKAEGPNADEPREAAGSPDGDDPDAKKKDEPAPVPADPKKAEPPAPPPADAPPKEPKKEAPPKEPKKEAPPKEPKKGEPGGDGGDGDDGKGEDGTGDDGTGDEKAGETDGPSGPTRLTEGSIRLVVLGDADLVCNTFNPQAFLSQVNGASGFTFVQNMADWLSGSEALMALRSRATNPRNLEQMEEGKRDLVKHVNLLLVPLLVLLAGMTVFIVRRS